MTEAGPSPDILDVLVIGAGPAGSTAAIALARSGLKVLLADGSPGSDDQMNGDVLITGPALRGLASLGLRSPSFVRPVEAIDVRFGTRSRHVVDGPGAAIGEWMEWRRWLRQVAVAAGARYVQGAVTSVTRDSSDHLARIASGTGGGNAAVLPVLTRHVVVAAGARPVSDLGAECPSHALGTACTQRFTGMKGSWDPTPVLTVPAPGGPGRQRGCTWALPGPDGTATIGTAMIGGDEPACADDLLTTALDTLTGSDPRFATVAPSGPPISGPLNTGFAPRSVRQARFLLVGETAGLVNPFTGEGFSYAVQSGLLAARAIAAHRYDPGAARLRYIRSLSRTFVGYFETARHARRRYQLAWRILAAGADSDHPFFAKGRRAILLPEGFSGLTAAERLKLTDTDTVLVAPFLAACDEVALMTVRREWPFLARLAIAGESLGQRRLRPALPFFAALRAAGNRPDPNRATLAAAIEIALLGSLALLGPAPQPSPERGVDWALTTAVLAGDFLLSQASRLATKSGLEVSWSFADWLAEVTTLRAARLDPHSGVPASALFAALLEFPARIGAELGGAAPEVVQALRAFGQHCGHAFMHVEDVLALRGERTRLDTTLAVMMHGRFSGIPDVLGDQQMSAELVAADPALRARGLATAEAAAENAHECALRTIDAVPDPAARRILRGFTEAVVTPVRPISRR